MNTETAFLPRLNQPEPCGLSKAVETSRDHNRVLVMDDESLICGLVQSALQMIGYEVETVADGVAAVRRYDEAMTSGRPFNVVILDLIIPYGLGAQGVIKQLLEIDPAVKAIVSSGNSCDQVMTDYRQYGFSGILGKPYTIQGLAKVLSEVLGNAADMSATFCEGKQPGPSPSPA